jgi:hypothetical protein
MPDAHTRLRTKLTDQVRQRVNRFDAVMHHVYLATAFQLKVDGILITEDGTSRPPSELRVDPAAVFR